MTSEIFGGLGWSPFFARQLAEGEAPARISAVHRDRVEALAPAPLSLRAPGGTGEIAVGDWVVHEDGAIRRVLERSTRLARGAVGPQAGLQLIAANIDTLAIVSSCNADFNPARLERYLALAASAGALPLIVLTKADEAEDAAEYCRRAQALSALATVIALDARREAELLAPWCRGGQALALVGSSGVGKTTLQNALTGLTDATQAIREDDAKGRHTTTARALRPTLAGGWLIDTPGMRELRLAEASEGIDAVFADLVALAEDCRFRDCRHESEPGCAIQSAIAAGELDPERLKRWRKLQREEAYASETVAEARARYRKFSRMTRHITEKKRG